MPPEVTRTAIPPLYYDPAPRLLAGILDSPVLPAAFETVRKPWEYAVVFSREQTPRAGAQPGAVVVRVTLEVLAGRVGIGVLQGDGPTFLDEVVVASPDGVAEVLVNDSEAAGDLVVRNASGNGKSRGRLLAIESFGLTFDPSGERESELSTPSPTPRWNRYYGGADTPIEKLRAQAFDRLTEPAVVRWRDGLSFRVTPNDQVSRALYVSGTYEPNTLGVLRGFLQPGQVFLDVGANAGVFTLVASHYVGPGGQVYSFEPSAREYGRLCDVVRLNGIGEFVTPLQVAVGAKVGHEVLRVASEPHSGLNTLGSYFPYEGVTVSGLEEVEVTTLDAFATHQALSRIDMVKIDIEGAEAAALAGAGGILRRHRPVLIVEVFSRSLALNGASVADVQHRLLDADYRLLRIDDETAELIPLDDLAAADEQNIVAMPTERV